MKTFSNFVMIIISLTLTALVSQLAETTEVAHAKNSGKMTLTCTSGEKCVTVICIDDRPCDTIQINSQNNTGLRDFLENKTKAALISNEIV